MDHGFVKLHVALRREQSLLYVDSLYTRVIARTPHVHSCTRSYQIRGFYRWCIHNVIKMHLVEMYTVVAPLEVKKLATNIRYKNWGMCQFPLTIGFGLYGRTKGTAENLVTKANSRETNIWSLDPNISRFVSFRRLLMVSITDL